MSSHFIVATFSLRCGRHQQNLEHGTDIPQPSVAFHSARISPSFKMGLPLRQLQREPLNVPFVTTDITFFGCDVFGDRTNIERYSAYDAPTSNCGAYLTEARKVLT
jgi:hypothetical protein